MPSRITAKLLGQGTVTPALLRHVAASFTNGDVEIIERPEEYRFEVKFVSMAGIPPNMNDLKAAIEAIKPAHLVCGYLILYRTWGDVAAMTWGETALYTWEGLYGIMRRTWAQLTVTTWGETSAYKWDELYGGEY